MSIPEKIALVRPVVGIGIVLVLVVYLLMLRAILPVFRLPKAYRLSVAIIWGASLVKLAIPVIALICLGTIVALLLILKA